jgi:proteasome lid subunit RPN8/RPN11
VKITASALEAVHAHVAEGYPNEICGMLVAVKGSRDVTDIRRATNANTERPRDTYQIDPLEHRAIEKDCDRAGREIVGYYHSHPDHASYASIRDTEQAWPDYYYLIVSCNGGEVREGKVFSRGNWDTRQMTEEPLEVMGTPGARRAQ